MQEREGRPSLMSHGGRSGSSDEEQALHPTAPNPGLANRGLSSMTPCSSPRRVRTVQPPQEDLGSADVGGDGVACLPRGDKLTLPPGQFSAQLVQGPGLLHTPTVARRRGGADQPALVGTAAMGGRRRASLRGGEPDEVCERRLREPKVVDELGDGLTVHCALLARAKRPSPGRSQGPHGRAPAQSPHPASDQLTAAFNPGGCSGRSRTRMRPLRTPPCEPARTCRCPVRGREVLGCWAGTAAGAADDDE